MGGIPFWKWSGSGRQNGAQDSAEALSVRLFDELTNKMCDLRDGKEVGGSETEKKPTGQGGCGHLCKGTNSRHLNSTFFCEAGRRSQQLIDGHELWSGAYTFFALFAFFMTCDPVCEFGV